MAKKPSPIGTVLAGRYGTSEIVGYRGPFRFHTYRPHDVHPSEPWNKEIRERAFCFDHSDVTPVVSTYGAQVGDTDPDVRQYDGRCSSCYLNHSHTTALHDANVAAGERAGRKRWSHG